MTSLKYREANPQDRQLLSETRIRLICFILLVFIGVICLSRWGVRHQNPVAGGFSRLVDPLRVSLDLWISRSSDDVKSWEAWLADRQRTEKLEAENRHLKQQLALLQAIQSENLRLRRLHRLAESSNWHTVPADVIGKGGGEFRTLLLNRGWSNGVAVNQPVVSYGGLVGRVMAVHPHTCLVLQITDSNSAVGVFAAQIPDETTGEVVAGLVSGHRAIQLVFEPKGGVEVQRDLPVFTSSVSVIYPAGLLVGWIRGPLESGYSLQRRLQVEPAVKFRELREVLILTGLYRDEAIALRSQAGEGFPIPETAESQ